MNPFECIKLGHTNVSITKVGLGTYALGGLWENIDFEVAQNTVDFAYNQGIRLFDTAPLYGFGKSEQIVGSVLKNYPRDSFVLATKVGRILKKTEDIEHEDKFTINFSRSIKDDSNSSGIYFDYSYSGIMRSVESSIERTGIDHFDIVHIHDPDLHPGLELGEALQALRDLKDDGVIKAVGCGTNSAKMLSQLSTYDTFDCFLLAGKYTLLDQSALEICLPSCQNHGIPLINAGIFNSGILCNTNPHLLLNNSPSNTDVSSWKYSITFDYKPAKIAIIKRTIRLFDLCNKYGVPLKAAALQFSLHHPSIPSILIGPRSIEETNENIMMLQIPIPPELWAEMKTSGLIHYNTPLP